MIPQTALSGKIRRGAKRCGLESHLIKPLGVAWWCRVLACDTKGRGFDSRPFHFQVTTLGKVVPHMHASVTKHYNLVRVKGR